jgi:hypothetical protein
VNAVVNVRRNMHVFYVALRHYLKMQTASSFKPSITTVVIIDAASWCRRLESFMTPLEPVLLLYLHSELQISLNNLCRQGYTGSSFTSSHSTN